MMERFLSAINSPGAHILICLFLLIIYSLWPGGAGSQTAHDIIVFAMGILSRSMGSGNKPESQPPNTITKEITSNVSVTPAPVAPAEKETK